MCSSAAQKINFNIRHMLIVILQLLLLLPAGLPAFPVDLSKSKIYVREGFEKEWVHSSPENCASCKTAVFQDETIKSIRMKKIFPDKFEEAGREINLEERKADNFTVGLSFHLKELPEKNSSYGLFLERIGINWAVYLNGHLLKEEIHLDENGKVKLHKATRFPVIRIPENVLRIGKNDLYFRLTGDIRDTYLSVYLKSPEIDRMEKLTVRQYDIFRFFIYLSYLIVGVQLLVVYFYNRQKMYLFLSFGVFCYGMNRFLDSSLAFQLIEDSSVQQNLYSVTYLLLSGFMLLFFNYLVEEKAHFIVKLNFFFSLFFSVMKFFLPHAYTFPFLLGFASSASLIAYPYIMFYRIGYTGIKFFITELKENLRKKMKSAFLHSLFYAWKSNQEFMLFVFIFPTYISFAIDYNDFSKYEAHRYTSDFSIFLFYGLMTYFTFIRKSQLTEKHRIELEKLEWEKETEKLKSELKVKKEREKIFADIHDNLGGKLLDLSFQLNSLPTDEPISPKSKDRISGSISTVMKGLRNHLLAFEDMKIIEEHFAEGLQLFLIRRYSLVSRKIYFVTEGSYNDGIISRNKLSDLLKIITELVNNDLKYGFGISEWKLNAENSLFSVQMTSETHWNENRKSAGNGHITMARRTETLGAVFEYTIRNSIYSAKISFPL